MKSEKKILALIGARSGSKGVKDKNIKKLGDKPLIAWIIKSATKSKFINRIIVSTDSKKYAKIAKKYNAETPVLRPKKISTDKSIDLDYVKHMLQWLKKNENYEPDIVIRLLATVPFQKTKDIDSLIKIIVKKQYDSAVIITEIKQHPKKALKIVGKKNKKLVSFISSKGTDVGSSRGRQFYQPAYVRANAIAFERSIVKKYNSLTSNNVGYLLIKEKKIIDIDTEEDFEIAKSYLKEKNKNKIF